MQMTRLLILLMLLAGPAVAERNPMHTDQPASLPAAQTDSTAADSKSTTSKPASDAGKTEESSSLKGSVEKASITQHTLDLPNRSLPYRATAANMLMKDEAGKTKATIFFVAYELLQHAPAASTDAKPTTTSAPAIAENEPAERPITFVFNGGPGAAAVWLHLGTAGPRRVKLDKDGFAPPPPYELVSNEDTWLDMTDLVFIDPVGTGFSRPAEGEKAEQFYGVKEDVRSVGEFIRLYLTLYKRWSSPKFLAGESYGTTRASALSEYLIDREGIALNGIALISSVLNFQTLRFGDGNDLPYVLYVPTYAAIAWYHHKLGENAAPLDALLKEVQNWASTDYRVALDRGDALTPDERHAVAAKLSKYTGLPIEVVLKNNLRIDVSTFQKELLADQRLIVGRFDGRVTGFDLDPAASWPQYDPSLSLYLPIYTSTFNDYVRRELEYKSVLPYETLSDRVQPWKYGEEGTGYLDVVDDLRSAMAKNPHLKILFASEYYDMATPQFGTWYTINHFDLGPLRRNITEHTYFGGHMMYHNPPARVKLHADLLQFIRSAVPQTGGQ